MQDRYAGDIGDFGKFGFLRELERGGLSLGINWYLTFPEGKEQKQNDGRYTDILQYESCDKQLADVLHTISGSGPERSVEALERSGLLKSAIYYREPAGIKEKRVKWHRQALDILKQADVVFLDPDNGLLVKSVSTNSKKAVKYIIDDELRGYLESGRNQAVIFYQHRARKKQEIYLAEIKNRILRICGDLNPILMALTFPKKSVRDYFVICPNGLHAERIQAAIDVMLSGEWERLSLKSLVFQNP